MEMATNLNSFFVEALEDLRCEQDTKSYIIGLLSRYQTTEYDLSKNNITLTYSKAFFAQDFLTFQSLGDWIFLCNIMFPTHLRNASEDYYSNIARLSYYSCYKLINRQWKLYEELADAFVPLVVEVKSTLSEEIVL